jgi:hypothetical protein
VALGVQGTKFFTEDVENSTSNDSPFATNWMFGVGCWLLDVFLNGSEFNRDFLQQEVRHAIASSKTING